MKKFYFLTLALICAFVANAKTVEIRGAFNSWTAGADVLTETSTGVWEITKDASYFNNCEAKIVIDGTWCGGSELSNNSTISLNYSGGNNFKITGLGGIKTATIKVVDKGSNKYEVSLKGTGLASYPEKLYLIGSFNSWATADKTYALNKTANEGEYLISVTFNGQTYFSVLTNPAADWGSVGTRYVPEGNQDKTINDLTATYNAIVGDNGAWILPAGAYYLLLDINNLTLKVSTDDPTAIDEVAADNAAVEYYNLQGVKVANPENGIFIKKQGNKVAKVVL